MVWDVSTKVGPLAIRGRPQNFCVLAGMFTKNKPSRNSNSQSYFKQCTDIKPNKFINLLYISPDMTG